MPFEMYIYNTIRKRYPATAGWEIYEQYTIPDGSRVDFYVLRRNSRGEAVEASVIEAKDKEDLMPADIDQVLHYSKICGTNDGRIRFAPARDAGKASA